MSCRTCSDPGGLALRAVGYRCDCHGGMGAWGHGGPAMGDLIVYDSEVIAKKDEVNQDVNNVRATAGACALLGSDDRMAVESFIREWKAFYVTPIPFWGASEIMAITLRYKARAQQWRQKLASVQCTELVGPDPLPEPQKPPGPSELAADWIGMLKVALPAAAVIAGVVLVAPVVWEYVGARHAKT